MKKIYDVVLTKKEKKKELNVEKSMVQKTIDNNWGLEELSQKTYTASTSFTNSMFFLASLSFLDMILGEYHRGLLAMMTFGIPGVVVSSIQRLLIERKIKKLEISERIALEIHLFKKYYIRDRIDEISQKSAFELEKLRKIYNMDKELFCMKAFNIKNDKKIKEVVQFLETQEDPFFLFSCLEKNSLEQKLLQNFISSDKNKF